jgi:hypothetical protein
LCGVVCVIGWRSGGGDRPVRRPRSVGSWSVDRAIGPWFGRPWPGLEAWLRRRVAWLSVMALASLVALPRAVARKSAEVGPVPGFGSPALFRLRPQLTRHHQPHFRFGSERSRKQPVSAGRYCWVRPRRPAKVVGAIAFPVAGVPAVDVPAFGGGTSCGTPPKGALFDPRTSTPDWGGSAQYAFALGGVLFVTSLPACSTGPRSPSCTASGLRSRARNPDVRFRPVTRSYRWQPRSGTRRAPA